jgi:hypothetical protein
MNGITRKLADFIAKTDYDGIPEKVREEAKRRILDYIGVTLAGSTRPEGKMIIEFVRELGGREEATIMASDFKSSSVNAALANGTMSHVVELGDWGRMSIVHSAETMGSATFALGERQRCVPGDFMPMVAWDLLALPPRVQRFWHLIRIRLSKLWDMQARSQPVYWPFWMKAPCRRGSIRARQISQA